MRDTLKSNLSREMRRWRRSVATLAAGRGGSDAVHRLRVLSRRCREGFRLLGCKPKALAHFSRLLSPARDLEMLWQRLAAERHLSPERRRLQRRFDERRQAMRRKLAHSLRSPALKQLGGRLQEVIQRISLTKSDEEALTQAALHKAYRRLRRLWKKHPKRPDGPYLHRLRRALRRLRYVCELTVPVGGKRFGRLAQRAVRWQRLLGEYQDALIAQRLLSGVKQPEARSIREGFHAMERETSERFWKIWRHRGWHKLQRRIQKLL